MVQPINYSRDVLSPIEGYLQGLKFGEGLNTERLGQQATQQSMGIQRESMDLQQAQFAAQQAAAAQARADQQAQLAQQRRQAEQGSMALMSYLEALEQGTATPADLRKGIAMFPQLADQFQTFASSVSEERLNNELQFGQQLSYALANDNTDAAANLLRTRQQAAEASGDEQAAATAKAQLIELQANPKGLLMQTLMPLASTMPAEKFDTFHDDILGLGGAGKPQSSIAKLQADLSAGLIDQSQYDLAVQNMAPKGMTIRSTPGGGFEMVQGPGAGGGEKFTEGQSKDIVYATRASGALEDFESVADELTNRGQRLLDIVPLGLGRDYQDPDYQKAQTAGTEFLQAILRKDTGAAITPAEQEEYGKVYLPQPGDQPEQAAIRKAARKRAVAALKAGMSPAQMLAVEKASEELMIPESAEGIPEGVDPDLWGFMTPEEKALFQ